MIEIPIKIIYLNGCGYSMLINDIEFVDLSREDQESLCSNIIKNSRCSKRAKEQLIISHIEADNGLEFDEEDQAFIDKLYETGKLDEECLGIITKCDCSSATLQQFVEIFAEECGESNDLGYCEDCGSWNYEYTVII